MALSANGICALYRNNRELRDSHLVPKALYRLTKAASARRQTHPVILHIHGSPADLIPGSKAVLCAECETRFGKTG
jgi:hypothetical protein